MNTGGELSSALIALMRGDESALELDEAALELARVEAPGLDAAQALATIDGWAGEVGRRLPPAAGGAQFLSVLHTFLFDELGFQGDKETYYAPANSCLDQVLTRRKGLPITLSVLYIELARRLLRPVYGVSLPAHFVCLYNDGLVKVFVDTFDRGRLMTEEDALSLIESATGARAAAHPLLFAPATKREILLRMIRNLRNAYTLTQDPVRLAWLGRLEAESR
jgi:regulator of sirC expression with transglutaminase-like and TPR domain